MASKSERWIVVPGWDEFQHPDVVRSKNTPPWIKTYTRLLSDDDYLDLTLAQRGLLHGVWLEYARSNGRLTEGRTRVLLVTNRGESAAFRANMEALNHAGFIKLVASKPQARCKQPASLDKRREETPKPPNGLQAKPRPKTRRPKATEPSHEEAHPYICGIDGCHIRHATEERLREHRENVHGITTANGSGDQDDLSWMDAIVPDEVEA